MRNKMITLDPTSYEVARKMKNFSGWVREMLKYTDSGERLDEVIRQRQFWRARCEELEQELKEVKEE